MSLRLTPTFRAALAASDRPLAGMWVCSASATVAEIAAGSGLDWLLIDMEHSATSLDSVLAQVQVAAAYPVTPVVRVPWNDAVTIKRVLDVGAQNLIVPMISTAAEARAAVAATRYPPAGIRGVGSALARSARWNRVDGYLATATEHVSLTVQIETAAAVDAAAEIAAVEGVDAVFVGPSDLSASMGLLGQQSHPDVVAAVHRVFEAAHAAGVAVGVNAFDPLVAEAYLDAGADFVAVGADVALLARASEALAARFVHPGETTRGSY
ncbi:MAG: 2-dehydro-3-deoxyglucarate aldolase [Microbacterium sp. 71-36]|uniref:aldolase/citrate lyase family protein n=1 Tax=unclassified Microbacterium TaxID=2609290 RepID=UPI00086B882C|nr:MULTISPECIES: aldolase/citrate lyase family protein [unclassified Microbacterium]MBN9210162.1 2-dehydro-3-deoxyglucarate aldolase [Microbacterium sp.]ODT38248.1 MAG: 2-dehydro-3-deoxyglucarate aldolase [Microbacterium sp. SCN 71-17]OJV76043.1 MAG: 2-dehydro-3-deoxyglucarate aldolase [Microbacterium sp. 71-36]